MMVSDRSLQTLHLAAFDHRTSLDKALAALHAAPNRDVDRLAAKLLIWSGVAQALGVTDNAAVLVDADAGAVLDAARTAGVTTAIALERSGQRWLESERSAQETRGLLQRHRPDYAKLLVRWHPSDPLERQQSQIQTMIELNVIARDEGAQLMLELLIPADGPDAPLFAADPDIYHDEVLPVRLADSIRQLSDANVVPSMWKIDGLPRPAACAHVADAVRTGSDGAARIVILGAGKDLDAVRGWFEATATHPEFVGFAIGRTIWWDALEGYVNGALSKTDCAQLIGDRFGEVVAAYRTAVGEGAPTTT